MWIRKRKEEKGGGEPAQFQTLHFYAFRVLSAHLNPGLTGKATAKMTAPMPVAPQRIGFITFFPGMAHREHKLRAAWPRSPRGTKRKEMPLSIAPIKGVL